jgi:DNA helicase II / ATP-dependent DNA helicase PcrA
MADAIRKFIQAETVADTLLEIGDSFRGLQFDMGKAEDDIFYADPPFLHLAEYAWRYNTDHFQFVDDIEKAKEQLAYLPPFDDDLSATSAEELWKRPIHLMTALRAKGKEFDSVILLDVNDGIWPSRNARTPEQREAERRVFYVAFTRARKRLLIAAVRSYAGKSVSPSQYIGELGYTFEDDDE